MKSLQRLCAAVVLTLALHLCVLAGDIHTPKTDPPPPPPSSSMTVDGDIQIPAATSETTSSEGVAVDPMREFALNLMLSVLSLF